MKTQLAEILNQEMDRKSFLRYVGIASVLLLGGGAIINALGAMKPKVTSRQSSLGYGGSVYGGQR